MLHILVRHRTVVETASPPFSPRSFRALSGPGATAAQAPPGYADTPVPLTGATLAECIYLSGLFAPPALCSGIGRCGLCRARFLSPPPPALDAERSVLSGHDLDAGWRLACRHAPEKGMHILIPAVPAPSSAVPEEKLAAGRETGRFGLAVDLGTTSIHWRLVACDGNDSERLPHGVMTNPQMGAGSDVVSRIAHSMRESGGERLRLLVTDALAGVMAAARADGFVVSETCVAANPAMTGIFLGRDVSGLAHAPYSLPCAGNGVDDVPGLGAVYIPPQIAPFMGGDVSAGYAALALDPETHGTDGEPIYPFLLADMGTNGECVLALSPSEALAASLPMGPALEGISLAFGSAAVPGAVTDYALSPYGIEPVVMGGTAPTGITATGYLSLLRILRASNLLSEDGLFMEPDAPLSRKMGGGDGAGGGGCSIRLPGKMALFASDVEEILKVKAAFTLAVSRLLRAASLSAGKLVRVYLAGSLGCNVSLTALSSLGFLPPGCAGKVVFAGNTSLAGAALFLRRERARDECARWAASVTALDLASEKDFGAEFARHMAFAWRA